MHRTRRSHRKVLDLELPFGCSNWLSISAGANMLQPRSGKLLTNENKYPYIVELAVAADGLEVQLSRRVLEFHKSRHIQPRHGRTVLRESQIYYRWCFANLATARDFIEQFGGALRQSSVNSTAAKRRSLDNCTPHRCSCHPAVGRGNRRAPKTSW